MGKDFVVKVSVRNGRLLRAIRAQYASTAEMCRLCGINQSAVAALLVMRASPITQKGDWSKTAYDISSAVGVEPEALWPRHIAEIKLARNERELDMSLDEVAQIASSGAGFAARVMIGKWVEALPERKRKVINMFLEGATMNDIASFLNVSRPRADQLLEASMRMLRHRAKYDGVRDSRGLLE